MDVSHRAGIKGELPQYAVFKNGAQFIILLCSCKLHLQASFQAKKNSFQVSVNGSLFFSLFIDLFLPPWPCLCGNPNSPPQKIWGDWCRLVRVRYCLGSARKGLKGSAPARVGTPAKTLFSLNPLLTNLFSVDEIRVNIWRWL